MKENLWQKLFSKDHEPSVAKPPTTELRQEVSKTEKGIATLSMSAGERSLLLGNKQSVEINNADRDFFFHITLKTDLGIELAPDTKLETEKIYCVSISVGLNRSQRLNITQHPIKIKEKLDLAIQADHFEILDPRIISLQLKNWESWKEEFKVRVRDGRQGVTSLQLNSREGNGSFEPYASRLSASIHSSISNPESSVRTVRLSESIFNSQNTIILYIQPNGDRELSLEGFYEENHFDKSVRKQSKLRLGDYARRHLGDLLTWLKKAIAFFESKFGNCNLAIIDRTNEQTKWEMIELDDENYLGIRTIVVRWAEQKMRGKAVALDLAKPQVYQGRLVAYVHPEDRANAPIPQAYDCLESWQEDAIGINGQPLAEIASIHCHCHLSYGDEPEDWAWESLTCQREPVELRFDRIARSFRNRRLFFFVNAPYSARLIWEDGVVCGIAANALALVASGYIGVICEIEQGFANDAKKQFLKLASEKNGIKPTEFLRILRSNFVKMLSSNDRKQSQKAEQMLPYAFSYVYYGNPDDVVKITGGEQL